MFRTLLFALSLSLLSLSRCRTENVTIVCEEEQFKHNDICKDCQVHCKRCTSELSCTECKAGYYGGTCTSNCSESCGGRICQQKTGGCLSCVEGYYFYDDRTCSKCPKNCQVCLSQEYCTSCEPGFTGNLCQKLCVNCKEGSGCSILEGVCFDDCIDGHTGQSCKEKCAPACRACDRIDQSKCKSCFDGKHGRFCEKNCPINCVGNLCEKEDGTCKNDCKDGYWGEKCEEICPRNCFPNACVKSSGACINGCRNNFSGSKCMCPSNCTCDSKGFCQNCTKESEIMCNDLCSKGCLNLVCWRNSAKCLYGCKEGHQGETCTQVPDGRAENSHSLAILIIVSATSACAIIGLLTTFCIYRMRKLRNPMIHDRKVEAYNLSDMHYSTIPDHLLERTASGKYTSDAKTLAPHSTSGDTTGNYFSSLGIKTNPRGAYTTLSNSPASRPGQESVPKPSAHTPAAEKDGYLLPINQTSSDFDNRLAKKSSLRPAEDSAETYITPVYTVNVGPSVHLASDVSMHTTEDKKDDYLAPQDSK